MIPRRGHAAFAWSFVAGDHDLIIALEQCPDLEVIWRRHDDPANTFEERRLM